MPPKSFKKTRYEYVQGKLSWAKLVVPDQLYGCWTCTIHPTSASLDLIRDMQSEGLKNVLKKDEDGYFTKFRCPVSKERRDGSVWAFAPPVVVDKDGVPMDGSVVGDGSDGTLKLEVYGYTVGAAQAIAARLVGVRVDNLIKKTAEEFSDETPAAAGLKDQAPLF